MNTDNTKRYDVLEAGHAYALYPLNEDGSYRTDQENPQTLNFIRKEEDKENPGKLVTVSEGTTTEAVLAVLIDRMEHLQGKLPDDFNARAIDHLQAAFKELLDRRADRANRGVLGTREA